MAGMIYEMYGSTADRAPSAADINSGKGLVRGLFCLVCKDASEKARKQEIMHSYGLFWQLPASRGGVNYGGPCCRQASPLLRARQAFDRLFVRTVSRETARPSRRDLPWSLWNSPPVSLSGLLCSNIMLVQRAPGHTSLTTRERSSWDKAFPSDADPWPRRSFRRHQLKHAKRPARQCVESMLPPSPRPNPGGRIRLCVTITTQHCPENQPRPSREQFMRERGGATPLLLPSPAPRPCSYREMQ